MFFWECVLIGCVYKQAPPPNGLTLTEIKDFFARDEKITIFAVRFEGLVPQRHWRDGRVVDYGSLENC